MQPSPTLPLIALAPLHLDRTAIIAEQGRLTYRDLLDQSARTATTLLDGADDLHEARVAFLTAPGTAYVVTQWATWRAGGVAVPLCVQHPEPELAYVINDAQASIIVADPAYERQLRPIAEQAGLRFLLTNEMIDADPGELPAVDVNRRAMIVYTSGTTGRPKGAVTTHANIAAQISCLIDAWGWRESDHILEVLPLHHVHGIVNVLCCALWSGAVCEIHPAFDPDRVWHRIADADGLTLFMAVPTIYAKLIKTWQAASDQQKAQMTAGCRPLRLMVSGSAALPVATLEQWQQISGHTLLERYGMTEIGMALSNPLDGERRPGCVGTPLPGVQVRLVSEDGSEPDESAPGLIEVKGKNVFAGYWNQPEATAESFTDDGWFKQATSRCAIAGSIGSSGARASTSSRPADTRSRRWRSKMCYAATTRSIRSFSK
jgi:malonyl-CoA/methylmalonyl-CoA synthetase